MKRIRLLAAVFAATSLTSFASSPSFGPVNFKLFSIQQAITNQMTVSTNETSSSTNITQTTLSTTQTTIINNKQLLDMLSNSFNRNWPAGATLKIDSEGDFNVVTGSNSVQDVSSVLSYSFVSSSVYGTSTTVDKVIKTKNGSNEFETQKLTATVSANFVYDDSALTTANGKTTRITMTGIVTDRLIRSSSNTRETSRAVSRFIGTGTGSISNAVTYTPFIVEGTFTDTVSGP